MCLMRRPVALVMPFPTDWNGPWMSTPMRSVMAVLLARTAWKAPAVKAAAVVMFRVPFERMA